MTKKLTIPQGRLLANMIDGCTLAHDAVSNSAYTVTFIVPERGGGFESAKVSMNTLKALERAKYISVSYQNWPISEYQCLDAGRQAVTEYSK